MPILHLLLRLLGLLIVGVIALFLLGLVLHLVGLVVSLVVGLAILAGFFYLLKYLFQIGGKPDPAKQKMEYKVYDMAHPSIMMFLKEPAVQDLVKSLDQNQSTQLLLDGTVLELDNHTNVIVLENKESDAVKVRINGGKWNGRTGWICRSVLVEAPKQTQ